MRLLLPLVAVLALLAALHGSAAAWTYGDTLTVIWKPLPNVPAILRPGDTLTVWANAPAGAGGWSAALNLSARSYPLALTGGGWQPSLGWWVLSFAIPPGLPDELYDLALTCSACAADVARHAVRVIPAFKSDFYFAQVTDTHLPSHVYSSDGGFSVADTSSLADFDAVIDDFNVIRPEFVLHTGDVVNEGELEEYLGMHELGRAQGMIARLRDPIFYVSGNHDIGGWTPTPPPAGTSRKNWWRYFGWPALASPPAGYPYHSQDYSFDYGLLHCVGMEGYENSGGYDNYLPAIYGASSMTAEQMSWLAADLAAAPPGHTRLAFIHYDYRSQFANLAGLGLDGAIWGHDHGVPEGDRGARPFNLGLQSCLYNRSFRLIRVHDGVMTPGPMHRSGGAPMSAADSLTVTWSGANDGTRSRLSATVRNLFGEAWDHARLVFHLANHDSVYAATGGAIAQVVREGGTAAVYVDCTIPAAGTLAVSVVPTGPLGVPSAGAAALRLEAPRPNPFRPGLALSLRYTLPSAGHASIRVYDLGGRLVATLLDGRAEPGDHALLWDGCSRAGELLGPGVYLVRLLTAAGERRVKLATLR